MWNVAILALMPALALAGKPGNPATTAADNPKGVRMVISATTERIPLPHMGGPIALSMDALARRIRLVPARRDNATALANHIAKHVGLLCPRIALRDGAVEMTCRSARIEAQVTPQGKDSYLDINELRGLPWRPGADAPPSYHYDPWRTGLGQSCPGKSHAARGECEFKEGHQLEAAIHFRAALDSTSRQLACVRLGDLAIATGDPMIAAGWYRRAGTFGSFGRIAQERLCELDGSCLESTEQVLRTFDTAGLPEPLRAESILRAARAEAYAGRLPSAAHVLARQVRAHGMASVCREGGELLCRRILLEAMRAAEIAFDPVIPNSKRDAQPSSRRSSTVMPPLEKAEREYLEELVETYLAIPSWEKGPLALEMAESAAPLAARLGAPAFGGNLLAALAPQVPDAQLADHLLLAAETFMRGPEWARARLVAEYAQSRLGGKGRGKGGNSALRSPRWTAVYRALALRAEQDEVSPSVRAAIETEFAATLEDLRKASETIEKADSVLGGTRAAKSAGSPPTDKGTGARAAHAASPEGSGGNPARAASPVGTGARAARAASPEGTGGHAAPGAASSEDADPSAKARTAIAKNVDHNAESK